MTQLRVLIGLETKMLSVICVRRPLLQFMNLRAMVCLFLEHPRVGFIRELLVVNLCRMVLEVKLTDAVQLLIEQVTLCFTLSLVVLWDTIVFFL